MINLSIGCETFNNITIEDIKISHEVSTTRDQELISSRSAKNGIFSLTTTKCIATITAK